MRFKEKKVNFSVHKKEMEKNKKNAKHNSKFRKRGKNKSGKYPDFIFYLISIPESKNYY